MNLNDLTGASKSLVELGNITMSGVVVIFALLFLLMFIGMFFSQNKNIRILNKENKRALKETIEIYEKSNNDMQKRLMSLEHDKHNMDEYVKKIQDSNNQLMRSNEELKSDRLLLHKEIEKLTSEVKKLRKDYQECIEKNMEGIAKRVSKNRAKGH